MKTNTLRFTVFVLAYSCVAVWPVRADDTTAEPDSDAADITATIYPASELDPPLRYRFWPSPENQRQRNAMVVVNRALLLAGQVGVQNDDSLGSVHDVLAKLIKQPLDDFAVDEAKEVVEPFETAVKELRRGENWMRLEYDLGMEEMTIDEKVATLLPEFQEFRLLARLLALRAKIAVDEQRWEDAISDLRLGFRLSSMTGNSTHLLISRVIGIAIAQQMYDIVEIMVSQPNCPSLYWALATIPVDQLYEMRSSIEHESYLVSMSDQSGGLRKLTMLPMGQDEALQRIDEMRGSLLAALGDAQPEKGTPLFELETSDYVASVVDDARKILSDSMTWADRLDELSDAEIVVRADDLELRRLRDGHLRWTYFPQDLWYEYTKERRSDSKKISRTPTTVGQMIASLLLPAVEAARQIEFRVKQHHNRLMTLEALRVHAQQSSQLPESIEKLRPFPAWRDAISDKPFGYMRHSSNSATLTAADPRDRDVQRTYNILLKTP